MRRAARAGCLCALSALAGLGGCTPVVRYTDVLVNDRDRTLFTRLPAALGGTAGFAIGVPVDIVAFLPLWIVYRSQPKETRDPLSIFLFPSFVLWKVGVLFGAPFDLVEWGVYRSWQPPRALTQAEREAIEREWDNRQFFSEYPVTPIYPPPPPRPQQPPPDGS